MFTIVGSHNLNHAKLHLLRLQIKSESGEQEINNIGRCLICVVPLIKIYMTSGNHPMRCGPNSKPN